MDQGTIALVIRVAREIVPSGMISADGVDSLKEIFVLCIGVLQERAFHNLLPRRDVTAVKQEKLHMCE